MLNNNFFGIFLQEKRLQKGITIRELASKVHLSHSYLSYIEKGVKLPPSNKILIRIADALGLDLESRKLLFDIATQTKEINNSDYHIPADISKYIYETEAAKDFLREADELGYSNEFWNELLSMLKSGNMSQ